MPVRLVPITLVGYIDKIYTVVHVVDTMRTSDLSVKLTSSRFKALLPSWEQLLVQVMPDDHSKSVPPLPIPNRTVKRLCADDSAATSVKVGYRQASYKRETPYRDVRGFFSSESLLMSVI